MSLAQHHEMAARTAAHSAGMRQPVLTAAHIQPHGVLIATAPQAWRITHVSENCATSLGVPTSALLGTDARDFLGGSIIAAIEQTLADASYVPANVLKLTLPVPRAPQRQVLVHRQQGRLILELEDAAPTNDSSRLLSEAQAVLGSLRVANTVDRLCARTARHIRRLTGYDRVMIYRFDSAGHGIAVAEEKAHRLPAFLNFRYPANNFPPQVRDLYIQQRVRCIANLVYQPANVLSLDGSALDMTRCALRGASAPHLEHLKAAGARASLAVALVRDGVLWGMMVCHHMAPRAPPPDLRALCDLIGQLLCILLPGAEQGEALHTRQRHEADIAALMGRLTPDNLSAGGLAQEQPALLALLQAGGALVRCGGELRLLGETPPQDTALGMVEALLDQEGNSQAPGAIAAMCNAGTASGIAAAYPRCASGILAIRLAYHPGDLIAWFRPELISTLPAPGGGAAAAPPPDDGTPLSPNASFAAWAEKVRGHSAPWDDVDMRAAEDFRSALTRALLQQAEAKLARLAAYDPLTGLANRHQMEARLQAWRADGAQASGALLLIDLDRFKIVNDTLGLDAGDACLQQLADRLRQLAPAGSKLGRLGGDEFVLFWPGATRAQAEGLADCILAACARPYSLAGRIYQGSASIGIACAPIAGLDRLMPQADAAISAAKRAGGGRRVLFNPSIHDPLLAGMLMEQDLFRALEAGELAVHYQPIVHMADRRIAGFEALARWQHTQLGWVPPDTFILVAEQTGLINRLGSLVLRQALADLAAWRRVDPALSMSVNVSPRQLADGYLRRQLSKLLREHQLPPAAVCLEVTESAMMDAACVEQLQTLRALGVRIAVDDFGTGHSSLAYLQDLPVDVVKIDRRFVARLGDSRAQRIFAGIVDLAHAINLRTVAEGCETQAQWDAIAAAGCETVQGWLVAPALGAAAAAEMLQQKNVPL